jgi:Tol biopolymer transport system component
LGAAGRVAEFAPLPVGLLPAECRVIAGSPSGTSLAYAAWDMRPPGRTAEAGLVDVVTGERRLTSVPPGVTRYLSLASDGQTLAFQLESRSDAASGIYVAPAAATDWVAQGRLLTDAGGQPYDAISPVISADGQAVYATVAQPGPWDDPKWTRLLEVPVAGGQPRVVFELRYQEDRHNVVYMWGSLCRDPAGESLLAFATGCVYRIEISSGATTRLPFPEGQPYDAAW